jgi:excisionase family DNA binding protein
LIKDKYLTLQVVADLLSCTERHIFDLIAEGYLIAIKVGSRAVRVSEKSLEEFIEKQKVNPEDFFDPDKEKQQSPVAPSERSVARSKFLTK